MRPNLCALHQVAINRSAESSRLLARAEWARLSGLVALHESYLASARLWSVMATNAMKEAARGH
jgi:hypothetical protein